MVLAGKIVSEVKTFRWESGVILHQALARASYINSLRNRVLTRVTQGAGQMNKAFLYAEWFGTRD